MKLSRLERNFTLQTIYQLISTIIPIFTIPFITRNLGADRIGYYSYLASICSYFVLVANLGSYSYGVREIAYFQNDRKKYSEIFSGIQLLRFYLSCVVLFFYFLYSLIFDEDKLILAILSLNIFNVIFDISWFYNGIEDFRPIVSRALVLKLLYAASLFIFVRSENNFYAYAIVQVGFTLLISLSYWAGLRNVVDFTFKVKPFKHLKGTFSLFLPALAIQMYTVLDKTMIGMFSTVPFSYFWIAARLTPMRAPNSSCDNSPISRCNLILSPVVVNDIISFRLYLYSSMMVVFLQAKSIGK